MPVSRKPLPPDTFTSEKKSNNKVNWPVLLTTILTTCASLILIKKWQNRHLTAKQVQAGKDAFVQGLNKINIFKNERINTLIAKQGNKLSDLNHKHNILNIKYNLPEMLIVSTSSILGGLTGGLLFDKKNNNKNKIKEAIFQFFNVGVPTVFVAGLLKLFNSKAVLHKLPKLMLGKTNITKSILNIAALLGGVLTGMSTGVVISNSIIDKLYKIPESEKRTIHLKDYLIHSDDLLGAVALTKVPLLDKIKIEKLLPALYGMGGYHAGNGE